jgi:hypothetical protein
MREFVFLSTYRNRLVRVHMGWSRALQRHYMTVEYTERNEAMAYSHENDPLVTRYTDAHYFIRTALGMGLQVPKTVIHGLIAAPLRDGTALGTHREWRYRR